MATLDRTPAEYKRDLLSNIDIFNNSKDTYISTYNEYMQHKPDSCAETNPGLGCGNVTARVNMQTALNDIKKDIGLIKRKMNDLGNTGTKVRTNFDSSEQKYAIELNNLKNIKQQNAESIMMKKITEDNQAINIVESVYLISGIAFMIFFIVKQLNK
tara:strand:+ start:2754 stop:3224 length:471 start_codon:yes stop_codon:yes gene_type:complete